MTLEELLKLLREAVLNDRTDRVAGSADYLWSDDTLVTYINEAQRRFAVRGLLLRDGTTDECTKITLRAGQTTYPIHPAVFAVMTAKLEDYEADLTRVGHSLLGAWQGSSERWVDPKYYVGLPAGQPVAWSTDETLNDKDGDSFQQITLRVYPAPTAEQDGKVVRLRVVRKPLSRLSLDALSACPEIPEDHHIEMLDYAAYLALRIVDDDAGAPKRAEEFRQMFEQHVTEARTELLRKVFAPTGWGFGRGGFAWEH